MWDIFESQTIVGCGPFIRGVHFIDVGKGEGSIFEIVGYLKIGQEMGNSVDTEVLGRGMRCVE